MTRKDTRKLHSTGNYGVAPPPFPRLSVFERHFRKASPTECWPWQGETSRGYGIAEAYPGPKRYKAHRVSYAFYRGPITEGYTINHLCGNRSCVNPFHLEPATPRQNVQHYHRKLRQ